MKRIIFIIVYSLQFIFLAQITFSEENNKNGIFKKYYDNGNLWGEETYKDGKLNGSTREFYKSGGLRGEWLYVDDELNGLGRTYYKTGQLQSETNYKNDKEDGITREYHKNGKLSMEVRFKKGKADGPWRRYYENGQLMGEEEYKDGEYTGQRKEFYANGWLRENKSSFWWIIPLISAIYFSNKWRLVRRRDMKDIKVRDVFSSKNIIRLSTCIFFFVIAIYLVFDGFIFALIIGVPFGIVSGFFTIKVLRDCQKELVNLSDIKDIKKVIKNTKYRKWGILIDVLFVLCSVVFSVYLVRNQYSFILMFIFTAFIVLYLVSFIIRIPFYSRELQGLFPQTENREIGRQEIGRHTP